MLPIFKKEINAFFSSLIGYIVVGAIVGVLARFLVPGRDPMGIEVTTTVEKALPTTDAESAELRDQLEAIVALGVQHLVMDFGHPQSTEPVHRFVEQVMHPMRTA